MSTSALGEVRRIPLGRRLIWGALAGLVCGAVGAALFRPVPGFENLTLDARFRLLSTKTPAVDQVAIVLIDNESIESLTAQDPDRRWPWPRELQAAMATFLKRCGARAVIYDVLFVDISRTGVSDDQLFGTAIADAGKVRLAAKLEDRADSAPPAGFEASAVPVRDWTFDRRVFPRMVAPVPDITGGKARLGIITVEADPGNTLRRADLLFPYRGVFLPSLGLSAALEAMGPVEEARVEGRWLVLGDARIPLEPDGRLLVRWYGPELTFPAYHAADLIRSFVNLEEGKAPVLDPSLFRDRIVFIGMNFAGGEDIVAAPTSTNMPGVEYHATVCANVLEWRFLRHLPPIARAGSILLAGLLGGLAAFAAWKPLRSLAASLALAAAWTGACLGYFRAGLAVDLFYPLAAIGLAYTSSALAGYFGEGRRRREVARAFGQYLSPVVIRDLMKDPHGLKLGGEARQITVFFSDLEAFSTFSERMSPEELVAFLNRYLTAATDVILARRGVVDKYIGDAVMAFWGAPEPLTDDARQASLAAIEQVEAVAELNRSFKAEGRPLLRLRAGLHRGPAVVGNMGSTQRFAYTAMGDTVNLASRLEGANKFFGTSLMATEEVVKGAGDEVAARRLGSLRVVGRALPAPVYELVGKRSTLDALTVARLKASDEGLALLEKGDPAGAAANFERCLRDGPDPVAERFLRFARERAAAGNKPWDGVWELTAK